MGGVHGVFPEDVGVRCSQIFIVQSKMFFKNFHSEPVNTTIDLEGRPSGVRGVDLEVEGAIDEDGELAVTVAEHAAVVEVRAAHDELRVVDDHELIQRVLPSSGCRSGSFGRPVEAPSCRPR